MDTITHCDSTTVPYEYLLESQKEYTPSTIISWLAVLENFIKETKVH